LSLFYLFLLFVVYKNPLIVKKKKYIKMPRRNNFEDDDDESTFTQDYRSVMKEKNMSAGNNIRLASHNKTRVAYFHDEGVGNYHYGVCSI
jgi:hypothetical protein